MLFAVGLGPGGFSATPQQLQMAVPYAVPAMILGPSVASILLTGLLYGRTGLREFRSRLLRWRVGARWYAVALLTAPLSIMAVFLALSLGGAPYWVIGFAYAAALWVVVAAVAVAQGGHLSRQPLPRRVT